MLVKHRLLASDISFQPLYIATTPRGLPSPSTTRTYSLHFIISPSSLLISFRLPPHLHQGKLYIFFSPFSLTPSSSTQDPYTERATPLSFSYILPAPTHRLYIRWASPSLLNHPIPSPFTLTASHSNSPVNQAGRINSEVSQREVGAWERVNSKGKGERLGVNGKREIKGEGALHARCHKIDVKALPYIVNSDRFLDEER